MGKEITLDAEERNRNTLSNDAFWMVNKKLTRELGSCNTAIYLSDLISKEKYFAERKMLDDEGMFFNTTTNITDDLPLSDEQQATCRKKLIQLEILIAKRKGSPYKYYYKINHDEIDLILSGHRVSQRPGNPVSKDREIRCHNKNKDNNNNDISKDIYYDSPNHLNYSLAEKTEYKENEYLTYWNNLSNTQKHKNPSKKIYQTAVKYIKHLKNGTMSRNLDIDRDWMNNHKIDSALLKKKFTDVEIKEALTRLNDLFVIGHWPTDKTKLPKDLASLIYNQRTKKSMLLLVMSAKESMKHVDRMPIPLDQNNFTRIEEAFIQQGIISKYDEGSIKKRNLIKAYNYMHKEITAIVEGDVGTYYLSYKGNFPGAVGKPGSINGFVRGLADLIANWTGNLTVDFIKPGRAVFRAHVDNIKRDHEISLYPDKDEFALLKKKYNNIEEEEKRAKRNEKKIERRKLEILFSKI